MNLATSGVSETIAKLGAMTKEGKQARRQAVTDTGKMVAKRLKKRRTSRGDGSWKPLGKISRTKKHRRPWGKTKIKVYTLKRTVAALVTTKGRNYKMEKGGTVTISDAFKRYLHSQGIHLRKNTHELKVPARPLFGPVFKQVRHEITRYFEQRFHYRLGRAMRRWKI